MLLYCYHGNASQMFADFGFAEVNSLDGGFAAWQRAQKNTSPPVISPQLAQWLQANGCPTDDLDAPAANGITPLMRASKAGRHRHRLRVAAGRCRARRRQHRRQQRAVDGLRGRVPGSHGPAHPRRIGIDHQNDNSATCLMYAASTGKHAVVEALLAAGADPKLETLDGFSALEPTRNSRPWTVSARWTWPPPSGA